MKRYVDVTICEKQYYNFLGSVGKYEVNVGKQELLFFISNSCFCMLLLGNAINLH